MTTIKNNPGPQNLNPQEKRQARELALQILFQTEFQSPFSMEELLEMLEERLPGPILKTTHDLVTGVHERKADLDALIQAVSAHWKVARMSLVDRNILRLSVFEMKFASSPVKPNIAINEAVEIAKKYGSTDSSAFVNGVLDQIGRGL